MRVGRLRRAWMLLAKHWLRWNVDTEKGPMSCARVNLYAKAHGFLVQGSVENWQMSLQDLNEIDNFEAKKSDSTRTKKVRKSKEKSLGLRNKYKYVAFQRYQVFFSEITEITDSSLKRWNLIRHYRKMIEKRLWDLFHDMQIQHAIVCWSSTHSIDFHRFDK